MPEDHPLASKKQISLADLVEHPLVTYHPTFTGRTKIDAAFHAAKLHPRIALEAIDSDVIKTYVLSGMGVGILAEMAIRDEISEQSMPAKPLQIRPAGHLFGKNITRIAFKRGAYLRNFVYSFAMALAPELSKSDIDKALNP
jgi:LysR family cys regulon transcriptional activator